MAQLTLRRLRQTPQIRAASREVRLHPEQFIQPHFAVEDLRESEPAPGLPGVYRDTGEQLIRRVGEDLEQGVDKALLFGVPGGKAENDFNFEFTARCIESLKQRFGHDLWLAVDVCLCSHTTHGHCGVLDTQNRVDNESSVGELMPAAVHYAQAGADCVAPSDMMDGRVGAIRGALNKNGFDRVSIMSYSAKFQSGFYGPFRLTAESTPTGNGPKDRSSYQIDPARPSDAMRSSQRDEREGADILMVKPALPYLDVLADLSRSTTLPVAAYQTSGEYASLHLTAQAGLMDADTAQLETWTAIARAGASMIISYGARRAKALLS